MCVNALSLKCVSAAFDIIQNVRTKGGADVPQWSINQLSDFLKEHKSIGHFIQGKLVAFILYRELPGDIFEIEFLATQMSVQKKSIMKGLMEQLKNALSDQGKIWLEVHENNNAAVNLYKSLGFFIQGERAQYYSDGGSALLMCWGKSFDEAQKV